STTFLPDRSAVETISKAAAASSISSTMVLISGSSNTDFASVVNSDAGSVLFFSGCLMTNRLMARLRFLVLMMSCSPCPTTPKPKIPKVSLLFMFAVYSLLLNRPSTHLLIGGLVFRFSVVVKKVDNLLCDALGFDQEPV